MECSLSLVNKAKAISFVFSLVSIVVALFFLVHPKIIEEDDHKYTLNECVYIITATSALITDLLLYQATMDMKHKSLYYWPNPNYCLLSWIVVHLIVLALLVSRMSSCIYSLIDQNFTSAYENQESSYKNNLVLLSIVLASGQILIILAVKTVLNVFQSYNKDEILD